MIVAIHQPNYMPWLGYFHKIARADIFIFLDDVQYSKNSYCNRVRILRECQPRWMTVPVSFTFGDSIDEVQPAQADWALRHLDMLKDFYRHSSCFIPICRDLNEMYSNMPVAGLAAINRYFVERIAEKLELSCRYMESSEFNVGDTRGDDRLIQIVETVAPGGKYLSGAGGAKYQDEAKFKSGGLELVYTEFENQVYEQNCAAFVPGMSVIDAVFCIGWEATAGLISGQSA